MSVQIGKIPVIDNSLETNCRFNLHLIPFFLLDSTWYAIPIPQMHVTNLTSALSNSLLESPPTKGACPRSRTSSWRRNTSTSSLHWTRITPRLSLKKLPRTSNTRLSLLISQKLNADMLSTTSSLRRRALESVTRFFLLPGTSSYFEFQGARVKYACWNAYAPW